MKLGNKVNNMDRDFVVSDSILLMSDSYKAGHAKLYPDGLENVYSYLESRGGEYPCTCFFGLLYYLIRYLEGILFNSADVQEARSFWKLHFGRDDYFDESKWLYILQEHGGKLPLSIKAVPEGTWVPTNNVLMTIEATDPKCAWLVNFVETLLLKIWYPISVASRSGRIKEDILYTLKRSGSPESIDFRCHDFGYRGTHSEESAGLGAAGHLLHFKGTDTVAGIRMLMNYYHAEMCGFSIPATEHSIICSFGQGIAGEEKAYESYLNKFDGLIACVSDTNDIYNACQNLWGGKFKEKILNRPGCLVVRPDSGDPSKVVSKILDILYSKFGGTVNSKGYKVLNDKIKIIQGDGMDEHTIAQLYTHINFHRYSSDNLTVGSGGGLLVNDLNRDTHKFAIKASAARINGVWNDISKNPITDPGKKSKAGRLKLIKENNQFKTVDIKDTGDDCLVEVFRDGVVLKEYSLDEIRKNAEVR